jgi:hypothetical protein
MRFEVLVSAFFKLPIVADIYRHNRIAGASIGRLHPASRQWANLS